MSKYTVECNNNLKGETKMSGEVLLNKKEYDEVWSKVCVDTDESERDIVHCAECEHLCVINQRGIYAMCLKTHTHFYPFELDTRTHHCCFGKRKDDNNGK